MTPEERNVFEELKSNMREENGAAKFMEYAKKFPKEKQEFLNESYNSSKKARHEEKYGLFNKLPKDGQVKKDTNFVWFTFEEMYKKPKNLEFAAEQITKFLDVKNYATLEEATLPDGINPQGFQDVIKEKIDYSEYSNLPVFKNKISIKKYKDGLLFVSDETGKKEGNTVCLSINDTSALSKNNICGTSVFKLHSSDYTNYGEIDWEDSIFDEGKTLNIYLVFPKIKKNLAIKFSFKDNVHIKKYVDFFRLNEKPISWPGEFKYYRHKMSSQNLLFQDWVEATGKNVSSPKESHIKYMKEKINQKQNYDFFQLGYKLVVGDLILNQLAEFGNEVFLKLINQAKQMSFDEIVNVYLNKTSKLHKSDSYLKFLKLLILIYHTNGGTTFVDGRPIDYENKTKLDCYYFWQVVQPLDLCENVLNKNNFPIKIMNGVKLNDLDLFDKIHTQSETRMHHGDGNEELLLNFKFKNQFILDEAMNSQTGYLMPYDGVWPIKGDPFFKFVKFRETEEKITILVCDENERYISEVFCKKTYKFQGGILMNLTSNEDLIQEIYTKLAGVIRDCKILVERDSTMGYRGRIKPYGCKTDSLYDVYYYPRVKYIKNPDAEYIKREKEYLNESRIFSGSRREHIRKLPEGSEPSKLQILLAKKAEMHLPSNHTYVKSSVWGENGMTKKEKIYRSKSIDGLFFYDKEEMDKAVQISYLSSLGFEEYCEKYLSQDKWKITKKTNHDGGIDIRALKESKGGSIQYLLVQCKHWKKPIPPGQMRDFITACDIEKSEYEKVKMFIISSKFSPGAKELAENHNIKLIDGDILLK